MLFLKYMYRLIRYRCIQASHREYLKQTKQDQVKGFK